MKFGLGVNVNETVHKIVKKSVEAEQLGIDYVWVSDVPEQRYAFAVAAAIAANTKKVQIGLGLLSPFLHSPVQIANGIITLVETYGDRFELCIGPGDINRLKSVGVSLFHQTGAQNYIVNAKNQVEKTLRKNRVNTKIWLGAQGPKMLETSRFFDGVFLNYAQPDLIEWAVEKIGRVKKGFQFGIYALSYVYRDFDPKIHNLLRISSAFVALGASKTVLENLSLYEKTVEAKSKLNAGFGIESILSEVPLKTIELFSIFKPSSELGKYLLELSEMKIGHVVFSYPQNFSEKTLRELVHALESYRKHRT